MRLSRRVSRIDISGIRKAFEGAPRGAINLGLGQPDMEAPVPVRRAAVRAIREGVSGYTPNAGLPGLREAIARKLRGENRLDVEAGNVVVTAGASEALHLVFQALVDPGDEVLLPDPGFVSYRPLAHLAGGRPVGVPLRRDMTMDPEEVARRLTRRTRLVVVNSPSNPTGAVESPGDLRAIAEMVEDRRGMWLLSDEVYEHFLYEGVHASPGRWCERTATVNAASKTYAMTGWRLGYAAAPRGLVDGMLRVHSYIQACAGHVSQRAALAALRGPQGAVGEMARLYRRRRDLAVEILGRAGADLPPPRGAFYLFPRVGSGERFAREALQRGVITVPGGAFGPRGKSHVRLSYAVATPRLEEALERLVPLFKKDK
ncbi:MAG: pyridoxal phosphate-dependent aminotransferase [Euryarchaeota archaeon]|nr:pyridoxal phosphate-dependent aminotransferase [Euryarchaeota archaeon]